MSISRNFYQNVIFPNFLDLSDFFTFCFWSVHSRIFYFVVREACVNMFNKFSHANYTTLEIFDFKPFARLKCHLTDNFAKIFLLTGFYYLCLIFQFIDLWKIGNIIQIRFTLIKTVLPEILLISKLIWLIISIAIFAK